jgi:hypothetical protein
MGINPFRAPVEDTRGTAQFARLLFSPSLYSGSSSGNMGGGIVRTEPSSAVERKSAADICTYPSPPAYRSPP